MADQPLLVFGPRSLEYDFGAAHPLTPRRFGPGIDLLRAVGAEPGLAPEPAPDEDLLLVHTPGYVQAVKRISRDPHGAIDPGAGIGPTGDNPAFPGMHDAAAAVAGGSLRAMEAILRGDVEHAFHPGGGLHHAMPSRASGFCVYDDPALAIARARADGLRVLYIDLDVHHGDGVEAIHEADPGVLTLSFHESGRYLFPGTGFVDEVGEGVAAGSIVNVPLAPDTGESAWLDAVESILPEVAAAFGPDLIVSQHGADSHAWDPLAHLRNTTTAMAAAARLVDQVAHRFAGGRWLSTGGGGYGVYAVVPRSWSLVWLAAAHGEVPDRIPERWGERWAAEAARYGTPSLPTSFTDPPNAGEPESRGQDLAERQSREITATARELAVPRLLRFAHERGWWDPMAAGAGRAGGRLPSTGEIFIQDVDAAAWAELSLESRVIPPADPVSGHALVAASLRDGGRVSAAIAGNVVVGLVLSAPEGAREELLAVGVAPEHRRRGLAGRLLRAHVEGVAPGRPLRAAFGVAERDVVEPLDRAIRTDIARRLLTAAGFATRPAPDPIGQVDPSAIVATRA
jgi:acetoin utilization protein AcuC